MFNIFIFVFLIVTRSKMVWVCGGEWLSRWWFWGGGEEECPIGLSAGPSVVLYVPCTLHLISSALCSLRMMMDLRPRQSWSGGIPLMPGLLLGAPWGLGLCLKALAMWWVFPPPFHVPIPLSPHFTHMYHWLPFLSLHSRWVFFTTQRLKDNPSSLCHHCMPPFLVSVVTSHC